MQNQLVCSPLIWNYHSVFEQNVSQYSNFEVNPCTKNCTGIWFHNCIFFNFPSANSIFSHCQLITRLGINESKLSQITAEDLEGFKNLKQLYIEHCDIEHLPGNLFKHTKNLEIISFFRNKIKTVGDGLLTPLRCLQKFDLRHNTCIDYYFDTGTKTGTLEELKAKLNKLKSNSELCMDLEAKEKEIAALKTRCNLNEKKIETLMMQMQQMRDTAMNFVVKVNEMEFKVDKQLLKTHSKALETLIDANPETDCLELKDVSVAVFAEVLKFMKTGNPPNENVDIVELFGATCRLQIEALIQIASQLLQEKVNPDNAFKVLILCHKYDDHAQLKAKAFDEFIKNFPHLTIKREISSNPEKLKQLWKGKLEMDNVLSNN